ncbi:exo-alpha-sialidase [Niabella ginsengisoli]|uniref:exo-alpha-sialidase n=1 Tax=Niabella ginsengisoli TaxID=522298 RepID=A0ABS9SN69_9BACT|nr:sialidase family protein [Niabella ginsengisoli]MCH5599820.1 glycoside hydrolase [Niabella ginsengisoli]
MKKVVILIIPIYAFLTIVFTSGCYKEQHFDFPGPFEDTTSRNTIDSLPFPFDKERQAGVWLMKDGVADPAKILFKGFTDYKAMNDTLSWVRENYGMRLIPHRNYYPLTNADHLGGDPNSYTYNWTQSKYFVPVGEGKSFYMYAKVTVGTFSGTAAGLELGRSWETGGSFVFGFDGNSNIAPTFFIDLYGKLGASVNPDLGWPTANEVIVPGVPAEMEVVIHNNTFYMKINGTLCFLFKMSREDLYYFTPMIRPHRNFITVHDFYLESADMYTVDYVMHENEKGYARIQSPALAKASNGNLLLFAEGRTSPQNAFERVAQNTMPVGNTDIVMRRSTDNGQSWEDDISVIAGEGSSDTYGFPQIVTTSNGKIILHYSKLTADLANGRFTYPVMQTMYQIVSNDNGITWSQPVDISQPLSDEGRGYLKSSPGHGIELESASNKGRLVMPLIYGGTSVKVALSDDNGVTWRKSQNIGGTNIVSGSVVELSDSRLMLVLSHSNTAPQSKLASYSSDGEKPGQHLR